MLIGNKTQWEFLKKIAASKNIPPAFLFSGADSLGKRKFALEFIKLLNCEEKDFEKKPCQVCRFCSLIEKERYLDMTLISLRKKDIQVAKIQQLQEFLNMRPYFGRFKAVIIEKAEELSPISQNRLLKIIEEPKGKTVFIFITSKPEMLFETIRSRCENIKFYPLSVQEIKEWMLKNRLAEEYGCSEKELAKAAAFSEGKPGNAIKFLKNPEALSELLDNFEKSRALVDAELFQKLIYTNVFFEKFNPKDLIFFLQSFLKYLRFVLLAKAGVFQGKEISHFLEIGKDISLLHLEKMIEYVEELNFLCGNTNINQKLAFENLMLKL